MKLYLHLRVRAYKTHTTASGESRSVSHSFSFCYFCVDNNKLNIINWARWCACAVVFKRSKTVPCHLIIFLRNSKQNSIIDRMCALCRLATGCYWDRTLLQAGIVCVQCRIRMQRSTAYASDDKIHFNFSRCKNSFAICNCAFCACVSVFAVASCVLFMVCCSWLILRLWTMENYDSPRPAPMAVIIIIINFHVCLRKHTYLFHAMLTPSHRRWTIGHITASHDSFSMSILIGQWVPSSSPAARAIAATAATATLPLR